MKALIIIKNASYGTAKAINALRSAMQIQKDYENAEVNVLFMVDVVGCTIQNQDIPEEYYNIEEMLTSVINKKGSVKICSSYAEISGLKDLQFIESVQLSTMKELTQLVMESDKVSVF